MEDAVAVIDKIIEEHHTITERLQNIEQIANDAEAISGFEKAKEVFMPGRLDGSKGLKSFEQLMDVIEEGIQAHFGREEGALANIVEEYGDEEMSLSLHSLLLEHEDLRERLTFTKQEVEKLLTGDLPSHVWQAQAHDMRAYITHTRKLFEAHAGLEQELLHTLRAELTQAGKKKG